MKQEDRFTDQNYWEKYYSSSSAQRATIERICSSYEKYWNIWIQAAGGHPKEMIEIGAYPGRYIAYLSSKYGLKSTGLDFNSDRSKIEETMKTMGLSDYNYIQEDFFNDEPTQKYDLVLSNGFIEHFDDFNKVMDLHVKYMSDCGAIMIMIPNKNYFRKIYGLLMDKQNLDMHNLKCMHLSVFRDFAKRNNLNITFLGYDGGFAYNIHNYNQAGPLKRLVFNGLIKIFKKINPYLAKRPSKWYSANIIGIFTHQK